MELDKVYDYKTACSQNSAYATLAKAVFSNYQIFTSAEGYPEKEGYEWKSVDVTVNYGDKNAIQYGISMGPNYQDYYDIIGLDESVQRLDVGSGFTFTVNFNGIDYTECMMKYKMGFDDWGGPNTDYNWEHSCSWHWTCACLVPVGYDGYIIGLWNKQIEMGDDQRIYEIDNTDSLFFRFK